MRILSMSLCIFFALVSADDTDFQSRRREDAQTRRAWGKQQAEQTQQLLSKLLAAKGQGKAEGKGKEKGKFIDSVASMAGGMAGGALGKLLNNVDAGCVLCEYVLELMERQVRSKPRLQNGDGYYPGVMDFGGGNQVTVTSSPTICLHV